MLAIGCMLTMCPCRADDEHFAKHVTPFLTKHCGDRDLTSKKSPLLLWGPYLWAEGERGRKIDDLVWQPSDFAGDGVHPSMSGRRKVADQLLDSFTTDPLAKSWFLKRDRHTDG